MSAFRVAGAGVEAVLTAQFSSSLASDGRTGAPEVGDVVEGSSDSPREGVGLAAFPVSFGVSCMVGALFSPTG